MYHFQNTYKIFQTVNHANIIWNPNFKHKGLIGGHLNIRSLLPKKAQLDILLSNTNLDFLALSESWLSASIEDNLVSFPGFKLFRKDRPDKRGGGIVLYIKDKFQCEEITLPDGCMECLGIKIVFANKMPLNIVVIYKPPKENDNNFTQLNHIIKTLGDKELIIIGDFNINWLNKQTSAKLKQTCSKSGLSQLINSPTRISKFSNTTTDLIFTNKPERITKTYNLLTGLSDHNLILLIRKLNSSKNISHSPRKNPFVPLKKIPQLDNDIEGIPWAELTLEANCDALCEAIIANTTDKITKHSILPKVCRKQKKLPWFNDNLKETMKKRDLALKRYIKTKRQSDHFLFKSLRNKTIAAFRLAKANYFLKLIHAAKGNSKLLWEQIDKLSGKPAKSSKNLQLNMEGELITDSITIANAFNKHFLNICPMSNNVITVTAPSFQTPPFELLPVTQLETLTYITSLSNSRAKDIYNIDAGTVKRNKLAFVLPLTLLVNNSFVNNTFPEALKKAVVTPIHKAGNAQDVNNFRPISILPAFSKVIEKTVAKQLTNYLETNQLLHPMQFGFRPKYSTETACCHLIEHIKKHLDNGFKVGAIFLDLRKAFDTVNHKTLIEKLKLFNLSNNTRDWLASYLNNRTQTVNINGSRSSFGKCTMGVPQGSTLAPLLFSMYINDLPSICPNIMTQMYADDTVVLAHAKSISEINTTLNSALSRIAGWLENNHLALNVKKTMAVLFSIRALPPNHNLTLMVNNEPIQNVTETKYLGITIDNHLNFEKQANALSHKLKRTVFTFKQIRDSLSLDAAKTFFNALIISRITYCSTTWGFATSNAIFKITSVHKRALKILDKKNLTHHHCKILEKHNLLALPHILELANLTLVHKILNGAAPGPLDNFFNKSHSNLRSSAQGNCSIPNKKTSFGQNSLSFVGPKLWNSLPLGIKSLSLRSFIEANKQLLLSRQICQH